MKTVQHHVFLLLFWSNQVSHLKGFGNLPDASQEGILKQYNSYDDVTLFHYQVPQDTTRATFEFASFQDSEDCPSREVIIYLQHGSFPVVAADNATFDARFYTTRTSLHLVKTLSAFQPHDSTLFPVYNPLPGSWFAIAYLAPFEEKITQQGLLHKCRYSLGSIALWTKADQVEMIIPFQKASYTTKKHFSYYKFFLPGNVDRFKLHLTGCRVKLRVKTGAPNEKLFGKRNCIEYTNLRARALPKHDPNTDNSGYNNISEGDGVTFVEDRPERSVHYYLLVVSSAVVEFQLELEHLDCEASHGLYGRDQDSWYLSEEGLKYNATRSWGDPKEPKQGFQLFTVESQLPGEEDINFELANINNGSKSKAKDAEKKCFSRFEFNRIDLVDKFSTNYVLQGKSWYTKWVTVTNRFPIITRFGIDEMTDIGGMVTIALEVDPPDQELTDGQVYKVYGCLSKGKYPEIENNTLMCDVAERLEVNSDKIVQNVTKLLPFPEPDNWYFALQVQCLNSYNREPVDCWGNLRFASIMAAVNIHIQACDFRPKTELCGQFGACVKSHKNGFLLTSCRCASGYRGWTCEEPTGPDPTLKLISDTLLLTLSNLFFLPAILLALHYRLFTESLLYFATMFFSTFYHTCDQEINHKHLPETLENLCRALYVNKEVLQFSDFFCAILSFWVTIISMAKLPEKLVNFLHMFGVLLISVLVQYNRSGIQVFAVPIPLGIAILLVSLLVRSYQKKKLLKANKQCGIWVTLGVISAVSAVLVFALIETTNNYQYVHSGWHILIALSLAFLLPYCRPKNPKRRVIFPKSSSTTSEESELPEVSSLDSPQTLMQAPAVPTAASSVVNVSGDNPVRRLYSL